MKRIPKIVIETGVMAGSLGLVLITLSGETRTQALIISLASIGFYIGSQMLSDD
jgi:hypothetical protein